MPPLQGCRRCPGGCQSWVVRLALLDWTEQQLTPPTTAGTRNVAGGSWRRGGEQTKPTQSCLPISPEISWLRMSPRLMRRTRQTSSKSGWWTQVNKSLHQLTSNSAKSFLAEPPVITMPMKQYTALPSHRPPLRRDRPVRISLPDSPPRYIFPDVTRSYIYFPTALRRRTLQDVGGTIPAPGELVVLERFLGSVNIRTAQ